jgi:periplasmic copper chaperone A
MKLMKTLVLAAGASLVLAAGASAHVTLNPGNAPADGFSRFALRVPTEENVPTVKLSVQLPAELEEVGFQPKPGWKRTQTGRVVTWSGGQIGVGEFDEFGLSIHVPNTPGETLTFPATQTYANGKVVRWIGAPESDEPAPTLTIEAAESESPTPTTTTEAAEAMESEDDDDMENLALGFGIAGLVAGLLALGVTLVRTRKRS